MLIGLISDTHCRWFTKIPNPVIKSFEKVDLIIHAGDIGDLSYLAALAEIAPVEAVAGNNDTETVAEILDNHKIITVANKKIGITHGHLGKGATTPKRAYNTFADKQVDIIVFGHSHIPFAEVINNVLLINPGSVSRPRSKDRKPTVALLKIENNKIEIGRAHV